MENLFSIGELAKYQNISKQTLIFYDKIGLFRPAWVDPDNGYRYYSAAQLDFLDTILIMKKIGFSLKEIQEHMKHYTIDSSLVLLRSQLTRIDQQIAEEDALYSKLPNPGKLNLLSRRSEPLSEASDALNQRNKSWRESLYKDLKTVYDSDAIYRPFAIECLIELNAALERQKKELLGDLILEDVADEE